VTQGGQRYFLLLVDDASQFMWAILLPTKVATVDAIKHVQAITEKESDLKLEELCTNNGGEFTFIEFNTYYVDEGIQRHYSVSYTPQQNGVVKHRNQTMVATAHALLKQRGMPAEFW
jgi:hypothetical protein